MSVDDVQSVSAIVVHRWRRYGHDRAYVQCGERKLGYRDLADGVIHCEHADDAALIEHATHDLLARLRPARDRRSAAGSRPAATAHEAPAAPATTTGAPQRTASPTPAAPKIDMLPDRDLAANRPGSAARAQAQQLRAAAPMRTFFARVVGAKTDERAWRIGADGEEDVARQLARLGARWRVLHAVPVGKRAADVDHVVVGPGGVFTVNTKNHPDANVWVHGDTVKINGGKQPYVRNSRHEAQRAGGLLTVAAGADVRVRGVVAIVGAQRGFTVRSAPPDVTILRRRDLVSYLRRLPTVLDEADIEEIYTVARHLATWKPDAVAWQDFGTDTITT